ncbi:MAG TPA: hypothetical protein VF285_05045 [Castellaniella sp.]|uniref:hypothetical protein n=1 Tax=Castellaniella sp. TaxID=1955812 RepID=UPI002EE9FE8A
MRFTLGLLCVAALGATPATGSTVDEWPAAPKRVVLETPYGTLAIRASDYLYGAMLTFNQAATTPHLQGILNIPYAYQVGKQQMALVSEDKGLPDCPVTYYWVVINSTGYHISAPFGSCSTQIRLVTQGALLRMETPDHQDATKLDVWTFNGKKVQKTTVRRTAAK